MSGADDLARPIRLFGTALTILSVLSLGVFAYWLAFRGVLAQVVQTGYLPVLMLLAVHVLVFSTGLGVVTSTKWSFPLFRMFRYVMLFAVPLGTMVSYVTLRYIKRNQIQQSACRHTGIRAPSVCGLACTRCCHDDRAVPLDVAQLFEMREVVGTFRLTGSHELLRCTSDAPMQR